MDIGFPFLIRLVGLSALACLMNNVSIDADRIVECCLRKRVVCHRPPLFLSLRCVVRMKEDDDTFERNTSEQRRRMALWEGGYHRRSAILFSSHLFAVMAFYVIVTLTLCLQLEGVDA
jgi:hypothetical protein